MHQLESQSAAFTLYVPQGAEPFRVAVLLPGDGWPSTDLPGERPLQQWAERTHTLIVSVDPPGGDCWWTPDKHGRAAFLLDLLQQQVFESYEVDLTRVDLGGWSGGAFLAFGVPFYVDLPFQGGLVGACGADVPRQQSHTDFCGDDLSDDPPLAVSDAEADARAEGKRVYVARTTGDELVAAIDAGVAFWEDHGAETRLVDEGAGDHCDFDVTGSLIAGLDWIEAGR